MANERVTLYGLPIVPARRVQYGRVDPGVARAIFIRCALVDGDWETDHTFLADNQELVEDVRALEDRVRRRDILVDDDTLYDFFDDRVPEHVISARHFDKWWKDVRQSEPMLLRYTRDLLVERNVDPDGYPDDWEQGELSLPLTYVFEPTTELDGAIVDIPLPLLNRVLPSAFDWHVPGMRHDLVTALIRALPKNVRRELLPAPENAAAFLRDRSPADGPLLDVLTEYFGVDGWSMDAVPEHLQLTFRAVDERGRALAWSKDLDALKGHLAEKIKATITSAAATLEQTGLRTWPGGDLPRVVSAVVGGHTVKAYPALVDEGSTVGVRTFTTTAEQTNAMWLGTRRLLRLTIPPPARAVDRVLRGEAKLAMTAAPSGLHEDIITCALDALIERAAWTEADWLTLQADVKAKLPATASDLASIVAKILIALQQVEVRLTQITAVAALHALEDIGGQLGGLVYPGFVSAAGALRLPDVHRYLRAILVRLDALPKNPVRDKDITARVQRLSSMTTNPTVRWMIEELRVSLFAQSIGTRGKVSEERILREIRERS
jgi:ATP-dependent helicase HrpA